jgi:hypothetical protein
VTNSLDGIIYALITPGRGWNRLALPPAHPRAVGIFPTTRGGDGGTRPQFVEALAGARPDVYQSSLFKDTQMHRHLRLVKPEALTDVVDGARARAQ